MLPLRRQGITRPFWCLAPMADATDPAFRALVAAYHPPDATWTEFVSADGLWHLTEYEGRTRIEDNPLLATLQYSEKERPVVAQLFGANPVRMRYAARLVHSLGFDAIDLNMGCPDRRVVRQGAGAGLIGNPDRARTLIEAALEAGLPVSVKTRLGYNRDCLEDWLPPLLRSGVWAITIHARTAQEFSRVPARWERLRIAASIRDCEAPHVALIGNGDVTSLEDGAARSQAHGTDGVMVGRAVLGAPWFFAGRHDVGAAERLDALLRYTQQFVRLTPQRPLARAQRMYRAFLRSVPQGRHVAAYLAAGGDVEEVYRRAREVRHRLVAPRAHACDDEH